jgi:uncharacterized protein YkwD
MRRPRPAPHASMLLAALVAFMGATFPVHAFAQTVAEQVVELVNQERWTNGQLPPLKHNDLLDSSSQTHSDDMAVRDFFAHCDLDTGTLPWDRMTAAGYSWNSAGENIAAGYSSPSAVMAGWMASPGHRANILSTNYREIGVGYDYQGSDQANIRYDSDGNCAADSYNHGPFRYYWTQNFGRRANVYPVVIAREAYETESRDVSLYVYGSGWAQEMRFRNEDGAWSGWLPYASDVSWTLSAGNGVKTVNAELKSGTTVLAASDQVVLNGPVTAVPDGAASPAGPVLHAAVPNPFTGSTRIAYELAEPGAVRLEVVDLAGRRVAVLANSETPAGRHEVSWDGRTDAGVRAARGIYFARLVTAGGVRTVKMVLAD